MKALIAQVQQPQPSPQPVFSPDFLARLGVFTGIMAVLGMALAKAVPSYLDRFFQLREAATKARLEGDIHERDSDLKREESTHETLNQFTRTLLANQLQSSKQFQEEVSSLMQIQNQQIGIILRMLDESSRNQQRFFDMGDQIKVGLAELKLEIEKNRKGINDKSI